MIEKAVRTPAKSFILRLWPNEDPDLEMRGEIEHLNTGEKRFFQDRGGLLRLLQTWADDGSSAN